MTPLEPIVEALVSQLDGNLREAFEERAAILQYDAGKPRNLAEALALLDVVRMNPLALAGAVCMHARCGEADCYVIAPDEPRARAALALLGGAGAARVDLPLALASLGGAARLTPVDPEGQKARKPAYLK